MHRPGQATALHGRGDQPRELLGRWRVHQLARTDRVGGVAGEVAARVAPPQVEQVAHSRMLQVHGQGGQLHGRALRMVQVVVGVLRDGAQPRQRRVEAGRQQDVVRGADRSRHHCLPDVRSS